MQDIQDWWIRKNFKRWWVIRFCILAGVSIVTLLVAIKVDINESSYNRREWLFYDEIGDTDPAENDVPPPVDDPPINPAENDVPPPVVDPSINPAENDVPPPAANPNQEPLDIVEPTIVPPYIENSDLRNTSHILVSGEDKQLSRLYDYTKFHIGLYLTLATGILAALKYKTTKNTDIDFAFPLGLLLIAGMCGGIVASNIPNYLTYSSELVEVNPFIEGGESNKFIRVIPFIEGKHRLFLLDLTYSKWIRLEHTAFWLAVIYLLVLVIWDAESEEKPAKKYKLTINTKEGESSFNCEKLSVASEIDLELKSIEVNEMKSPADAKGTPGAGQSSTVT